MLSSRILVLSILLLIGSSSAMAQGVRPFVNYTPESGLPSSEVYYSLQDSKGFMWFATDRGVTRYDGNEFEIFTTDDGLLNNVVFEIFEDSKGRIWFYDYDNLLSYFENDSFIAYKHNALLKSLDHRGYCFSFFVDNHDTVYIGGYHGLFTITSNGDLDIDKADLTTNEFRSIEKNNHHISYSKCYKNNTLNSELIIKGIKQEIIFNRTYKKFKISEDQNKVCSIIGPNLIVWDKHDKSMHQISLGENQEAVSLYLDRSKIYVGSVRGGLKIFQYNNGKIILEDHYLKEQTVSCIVIDNEDGLWVTTTHNGIYYCSNDYLTIITKDEGLADEHISQLTSTESSIAIGLGNRYQILENLSLSKPILINQAIPINQIISNYNKKQKYSVIDGKINCYWSGYELYDTNKGFSTPVKVLNSTIIKSDEENGLLIKTLGSLYSFKNETFKKVIATQNLRLNDYLLFKDSIWIGTNTGIAKYDNISKVQTYNNPLYNYRVTSLVKTKKYSAIWSTRGAGVVFKSKDSVFNIGKKDGLPTNQFNSLHIDKHENIWASSNNGLVRFNSITPHQYDFFTTKQGLPSNEITDLIIKENKAFIGTKKGLGILDLDHFKKNEITPNIYIKSVRINDSIIQFPKGKLKIPSNSSFLSIHYVSLSYKSQGKINYKYKIKGLHTDWLYTTDSKFQLTNLPIRGTYEFQVLAQNENGYWSQNPASITIRFIPPFYRTIWFYILTILFFLIITILLIRTRFRSKLQQKELESTVFQLKNKALQSQMNPHFIFNCLNAIQGLISSRDVINSERYLSKFSRLLRASLQDSRVLRIPLSKEIENLNIYLELEKLRFESKLEYLIEVDEKIEKDLTKIPPMLIQPFIENSIIHGLINSNKKGFVKVSIQESNKHQLLFIIEDNGVGRINRVHTGHKSLGTKIVRERLAILGIKDVERAIVYHDLVDLQNNPIGTKVSVLIPIN